MVFESGALILAIVAGIVFGVSLFALLFMENIVGMFRD